MHRTLCLVLLSAVAMAQPTVKVWDRFEATVTNARSYADPYRDVQLLVTYKRPGGGEVRFHGFYDGGSTWRIRFMPDVPGRWRYEAAFSDSQRGARGSFDAVASDLPGMISQYAANPIWFGYKGGGRALVRSFHAGDRFMARNWDAAKRKQFLDWLQQQGYNTLSIASHYLNREVEGRGKGWDIPRLWPLDAGEFRALEQILDDLARRRILVYPFAGFFGKDSNFPRDPADQEVYIRYTVARLAPYWNHLFLVGGPEPLLRNHPHLTRDEVNRLAATIRQFDPFGHLLSVHNPTGDDAFKDEPWTSYGVLQGPKTLDVAALSRGLLRNHHPAKPLYAQETLWPGNQLHPKYTLQHVRKNAFVILLSAAALNYADMNGLSSSGFTGSLDLADRVQERHDLIRRIWDFFETVPFERMKPRQDLVDNGYCLAEEGREYLVYVEKPGSVKVALGPGEVDGQWIDAQNLSDRRPAGAGPVFRTPEGGDDWLLWVRRVLASGR